MLENKCPTCGRNLDSGYKCPVCSVYVPPKQDMKTPTKEQIEKVYENLRKQLRYVWEWAINESPCSENNRKEIMRKIITEWEKIRNSPK